MTIVLAALDANAAARPVLETAQRLGKLMEAGVEIVHVDEGAAEIPRSLATSAGVPIRVMSGSVAPALLATFQSPDVVTAVVGARGGGVGRRPAGRTALYLLENVNKLVVVVPPEAVGHGARPIERLLVPLEGTDESSVPIADCLTSVLVRDIELIVLHVFTPETMPRVLDRPVRDLELWADEFGARYGPRGARIECRMGTVGDEVARATVEEAIDMVVLSWSQDASPGHAEVIRDVLGRSTIPVLLVPVVPNLSTA